jgi:hypothetical protein
MKEIVEHTFKESLQMVPLLLLIYCGVEWIERKFGSTINSRVQKAEKAAPAIGAIFGCIPQCGFSVFASAMYTRRLITIGTLLAVYLSTSDEAIPIILSQPRTAKLVIPLILTKIVIAIIGGYSVDLVLRSLKRQPAINEKAVYSIHEHGCCKHRLYDAKKWQWILHPLLHTAKVFAFVFLVSLGIHYIIHTIGEENFAKLCLPHSPLQPVATALIGLIPNCAASVAITQLFLEKGISFGSAIAGLSTSAGLGMLVLIRDNKNVADTFRIIGLLTGISIFFGLIIQYAYG